MGIENPRQRRQRIAAHQASTHNGYELGDWVMQAETVRPTFGTVRDLWDDGTFNLVAYDYQGNKVGRNSPAMGGPTTYEPCCQQAAYVRIEPPQFPLRLNIYRCWRAALKIKC